MELMKIRIGHLSTFYHTAILLMAEGTAAESLGHEIEWRLLGTGPAIMQAFGRGELDLAYIGLPPAIIGMDQGIAVQCVAGGHMEGTAMAGKTAAGFVPGREPCAVLACCAGKTIGVPGRGSIHDVIVRDLIGQCGLTSNIAVRNFAWADLALEAAVSNEVAAVVGTPALAAAVKRFAGGSVLIAPDRLWPDNPSYGIVAREEFLTDHRDMVEAFLHLHEGASAALRDRPREAAARIAEFVGIVDTELVLDALLISPRYCAKLTDAYIGSTMRFVPVLRELGYIRSELAEGRIFRTDLIDKVHPGRDHY